MVIKLERSLLIDALEAIITQDIGGRGLAMDPYDNLVTRCRGNLERAARNLASDAGYVAIVTGFYVSHAEAPTVETDGPCGAIALAWILSQIGYRVTIVTDPLGAAVVRAGIDAAASSPDIALQVFPFDNVNDASRGGDRSLNDTSVTDRSERYTESFFRDGPGESITHLLAIERAGPSWTLPATGCVDSEWALFAKLCPEQHQDQVHNFRGQIISAHTAKTHLLFDFIRNNKLPVCTIGIGDGGNEIGMGSIPWRVIHANIAAGMGARIACRIATDCTITCGVSNWGAYALATAVACLRGRPDLAVRWSDARERNVLAAMVDAGAVDGVTATPTLSVDGLSIEQHLAIWGQIRDAVRQYDAVRLAKH